MVAEVHKVMGKGSLSPAEEAQGTEAKPSPGGIPKIWMRAALFIAFLFALALSVIFPFGMGVVIFVWVIAVAGALFGAGLMCFSLVKSMFGKTATFGYAPTTAYMTGKKTRKRMKAEPPAADKKESR